MSEKKGTIFASTFQFLRELFSGKVASDVDVNTVHRICRLLQAKEVFPRRQRGPDSNRPMSLLKTLRLPLTLRKRYSRCRFSDVSRCSELTWPDLWDKYYNIKPYTGGFIERGLFSVIVAKYFDLP